MFFVSDQWQNLIVFVSNHGQMTMFFVSNQWQKISVAVYKSRMLIEIWAKKSLTAAWTVRERIYRVLFYSTVTLVMV